MIKVWRMIPASLVFLVTCITLWPMVRILPQHGDEQMYIWKAGYYGRQLSRLDFSPGDGSYLNPGWDPLSFWAIEQPMGTHLVYALTMGITRTSPPALPYNWADPELQGPETEIPPDTLSFTRYTAVICASLGLGLIAFKFGWIGAIFIFIFLYIPHVGEDLSRAWAEGPLLLGFGLCLISYKTKWFIFFSGICASLKLTGLASWPLVFFKHPLQIRNLLHFFAFICTSIFLVFIISYIFVFGWASPSYIHYFTSN